MSNHQLNHCWLIISQTVMDKLQWDLNQNTKIFCKTKCILKCYLQNASNLFRPPWVKLMKLLLQIKSSHFDHILLMLLSNKCHASLQLCGMSIMVSQITGNLSVFSTNWWSIDFPHKGPVMCRAFSMWWHHHEILCLSLVISSLFTIYTT